MREIVLDTETTGLSPGDGHRIVEVGCVEMLNHVPTGRRFQSYFNPERDMPVEAESVHGLSEAFLADKHLFAERVEDLLVFLGDSPLVIHNADFDLRFLNAELQRLDRAPIPMDRAIDTVRMARSKFPGAPANLDALCKRFGIDISDRATHGALKDSLLLAQVYLELVGGRQPGLVLATETAPGTTSAARMDREPRPHGPPPDELARHAAFVGKLSDPIWLAE